MPFDPAVDFSRAEQARASKLSISRGRRVPDPLGIIEEVSNRHTFHIFNVGPWPQRINTGSTGWFDVPGCKLDREYVECERYVPGVMSELTIKDEYEYNRLMTDGWKFAQEIVGIGRNRNPKESLTRYGLFASKNAKPTSEEIAKATRLLHETCSEIVREARDLWAADRKAFGIIVKKERHFVAAMVLGLTDEPWMVEQTPTTRVKCPFCASLNDAESMKCRACHEVIDPERYAIALAKQEEISERVKNSRKPKGN